MTRNFQAYYHIVSKNSGKCLEVAGLDLEDRGTVHQWSVHGGDNQKWLFASDDDGFYEVIAKHSGLCLTNAQNSTEDGASVHLFARHNGNNQKWKIEDADDGCAYIISKIGGLCLDATWDKEDGTSLILWSKHGGVNQKWRVIPAIVEEATEEHKFSTSDEQSQMQPQSQVLDIVWHAKTMATGQFVCQIENSGNISLAEAIYSLNPATPPDNSLFRGATVILDNGVLTLECLDINGTKITLLKTPVDRIMNVTYSEFAIQTQVKAKALKSAIGGFSFGMFIVLVAIYQIKNESRIANLDGERVSFLALVFLIVVGVATGIGYFSGLSKSGVQEMTEFLLSDSQSPVLRFWVDCNQKETIIQLFKTVGLSPQGAKT
jgi:hypothetical protein